MDKRGFFFLPVSLYFRTQNAKKESTTEEEKRGLREISRFSLTATLNQQCMYSTKMYYIHNLNKQQLYFNCEQVA